VSPALLFFFGPISPYSWFAAERIGALLPDADWRPVFAGGVFKAAGAHIVGTHR
jgi:2-hydroxychromene-2-carboxylate isomerase